MRKHQDGYIWRVGNSWFGRWRDDVLEHGKVVRKQRSKRLADVCDRYKTERDVRPLLDEILRPLNQGRVKPESTLVVADYVEQFYLPYARENCKPSTYSAYKTQWEMYLAARLKTISLRDFRTSDSAGLLEDIHRANGLGRSTFRHLKSFLSGVFSYAINQGVMDGINPLREARIPKKASAPAETHAASAEEVLAMMAALAKAGKQRARAAVALMFFAGLRPGEARGVCWPDYDGKQLFVRQSIWRSFCTAPKTAESAKPVPVIEPLRSILAELRAVDGNPTSGPILRGSKTGRPLNLDNLARRVVREILKEAKLEWHGWYSLRRGIATLLNSVEKDAMAAKGLLRHASVTTTQKHYIKDVPQVTLQAMDKIEALCTNRANSSESRPN
jgi:integrase